jgi:hypothetical protein
MTRAEYVVKVRRLLDDTEFDEDTITDALNWFVYELANNNHLRIFEASDEISASQADTEIEFPDDMMTLIKDGFYSTVPMVWDMSKGYVGYGEFMQNYANFASVSQQRANVWTDFNNMARFAAPLNADHTFQVDYLREPIAMEEDEDECEIPDRYQELVSKGALARVMEINEDYSEAQQERDNLAPLQTTFIRNESRGGFKTGPNVIQSNRRGGGVYRADKDF